MFLGHKLSKILLLVVLVQVAIVSLFYIKQSWANNLNNLFPDFHHDEDPEEHKINPFLKRLPTDDDTRLINLTNFNYKINKETLCQNESVLVLIAVSSAPGNHEKRKAIRETWGHPDSDVKVVFILGDTTDADVNKALQIEDKIFNDIVQGNFLDSYQNMSYKSTLGLKYAIYNCPSAKFVMKCDDDVLINTPLLKNFLKHDLNETNSQNSIFCNINTARTPIRDPTGDFRKWYVSFEEWPEEIFPLYCSGWYLLVRLEVAFDIYRHAQNTTFFWIDDVFLTGIVARNIKGLKYVDLINLTLAYIDFNDILNGKFEDMPFLVGTINMIPEHIQILWNYVLSRPVQESILNETNYEYTIIP